MPSVSWLSRWPSASIREESPETWLWVARPSCFELALARLPPESEVTISTGPDWRCLLWDEVTPARV
jgi:hypothetical protein